MPIQLPVPYRGDTASVPDLSSCLSLTGETQLQYQANLVADPLPRRHSFSARHIQLLVPYRGDTASVPGLSSCRSLTAETQLQYQANLVAGPLPRRHSFSTMPIHTESVVDKVALTQVCL
jgi:hypothetical protein